MSWRPIWSIQWVLGEPGLHSEILFKKKKKKRQKMKVEYVLSVRVLA